MIASGGPRPAPTTLTELFFHSLETFAHPAVYQTKRDGKYMPIPHTTVLERVRRISLGLQALGLQPGDRVAILSENRAEWAYADWACLTARLADVPIYVTLPAEQVAHPIANSGAKAIFVSNEIQAGKVAAVRSQLPDLKHVISFTAPAVQGADLSLADVEGRGAQLDSPVAAERWKREALQVRPDDLATIIYTSGTTGSPKGVMLSHDNIGSNVEAARRCIPFAGGDVALSFLPLSHIFQRMGDYLFFRTGTSIAYAESFEAVPLNLTEVRPTMCFSVPRLYEKMYARVLENALSGSAAKREVFRWSRKAAEAWADVVLAGRKPGPWTAMKYTLAQKLVYSKLHARTGGRLRYFVSGGAPLAPEINKFFFAAGLTILEGYGLTETSPLISVNVPGAFRIGSVGKPAPGVEVMIATDGEVLSRGPHIMQGYYHNPEATREAVDGEGWFHTGDIGVLEDGFLRITDRKKDIIVTAGGKNIAPQPIENAVKTNNYVSQAVMIGDKRKFPVMLVVPNWDVLEKWAGRNNIIWTDRAQLMAMPTIHAKMDKEVRAGFAGLASFETPKKIALLEHDFSLERGELTPTLKVKRRVIEQRYTELIDRLYVGPGE